ncbi:MAG TPA: DUF6519 domain-containing protein, partial [Frankiaceae bacterium]|nr:DUF6519 domain-containing protein [Frankiaceae bacterium]
MRGDFSQLALDAGVYSQVLMQQGRVLVDADWNAAGTALLTAQRALAADLIGPHGGPATDLGFSIAGTTSDFEIGPGVYYVDGIRCALAPDAAGPDGAVRWSRQPYPPFGDTPTLPDPPRLAYLDLWERHVTCLQDDTIREVALGGPDTTSRVQVVWQVRVMSIAGDDGGAFRTSGTDFPLEAWRSQLAGQPPQLRVWAREPADRDDTPCLAGPDARYRGAANCLYRVEIASAAPPTFVWSRENGSVVAGWNETDGADLRVTGVRDTARGFTAGDWVELTWDTLELAGQAGTRARVAQVDRAVVDRAVITLDPATATGPIAATPVPHAQVRRWDQRERTDHPLTGGAVPVI